MDLRGKFGGLKAADIKRPGFLMSASLLAGPKGWLGRHTEETANRPDLFPTLGYTAFDRHQLGKRRVRSDERHNSTGRSLIAAASQCADQYRALCSRSGGKPTKSDDGFAKAAERGRGARLRANPAASCRFAHGTAAAARLIRPNHSSANQIKICKSL